MSTDLPVSQQIDRIRRLPRGTARTAAAEHVVRTVESDGSLRPDLPGALLCLLDAYTETDLEASRYPVFARALRLWDESPDLFSPAERHHLFWVFKWLGQSLDEYPALSREQALAFLDDMDRRFAAEGLGRSAPLLARFTWESSIGDPHAEQAMTEWLTAGADDLDDCAACTIGRQVRFLMSAGRYQRAIDLGLTQTHSCLSEPASTFHQTALAALLTGQPDLAWTMYRRAQATLDPSTCDHAGSRGAGFELLCRGGRLDEALRQLRHVFPDLLHHADNPLAQLSFWSDLLFGLSAVLPDAADTPTGLPAPEPSTVAELHAWLLARARPLAARFDARNGTDRRTRNLQDALAATPAPFPLPGESSLLVSDEDAPSGSPRDTDEGRADPPSSTMAPAQAGGAEAGAGDDAHQTPESLLADAETVFRFRDFERAAPIYRRAAAALEAQGFLDRAGLAQADAALCLTNAGHRREAHEVFRRAAALLAAGGASLLTRTQVLSVWAQVAAGLENPAPVIDAAEQALADLAKDAPADDGVDLSEDLAERLRVKRLRLSGFLQWRWAQAMAERVAHRSDDAAAADRERAAGRAIAAAQDMAHAGRIECAGQAFALAGRLRRDQGRTEDALWCVESAVEAYTLVRGRDARAEAAGDLIELLRATGRAERADRVAADLTHW